MGLVAQLLIFMTSSVLILTTTILIIYRFTTRRRRSFLFRIRPKNTISTRTHKNSKCSLPLGSLGFPFFGETFQFVSSAYSQYPESFINRRRQLYGKVFKSHIFGRATIISTDAEVNRFILMQSTASSSKALFVPFYPKSLRELMGKSSILFINGYLQRRIHGLIASFFKSPRLKSQFTTNMQTYLQKSILKWHHHIQNYHHPIFIQDEAKNIAFEVLVKILISLDPGEEMEFLKQQFQEFTAGIMAFPINIPGSRLYRSLQAKRRMVKLVEEIIKDRRKKNRKRFGFGNDDDDKDIVDVLMNDENEEVIITDEVIAENIIDMMIPAEDSVPILITLSLKYLSHCPSALQQLLEENMELKRQKTKLGEALNASDYLSLQFTQNVITETLRMGNIITGVMRMAMEDMDVKGHLIPKGWCVFAYFRSIHLDEDYYEWPYQFNPSRWQDKPSKCFNLNFSPFGGGQRLCPGLDLARLQASIFLHHFVTEFRWVAEEDSIISFPTVRMKKRMPIWVQRRDQEIM